MLSDGTIRKLLRNGDLMIEPFPSDEAFQPCTVDVTLSEQFAAFESHRVAAVDPLDPSTLPDPVWVQSKNLYIHPGEFLLGSTVELISVPRDIVAQVNGKSSLGRLGLMVHATAGFIDPGFKGLITLELSNVSKQPIRLTAGMRVAQLSFDYLDKPAERPYGTKGLGSRYQNQTAVQTSRGVNVA